MSGRRLQFGVAVLDGRLYVVGGRDGLKTLNTVECYNPHSKTWSVLPPMSTHRHGLGESDNKPVAFRIVNIELPGLNCNFAFDTVSPRVIFTSKRAFWS